MHKFRKFETLEAGSSNPLEYVNGIILIITHPEKSPLLHTVIYSVILNIIFLIFVLS